MIEELEWQHSRKEKLTMQNNLFQLSGIDQLIPVHGIEGAMEYNIGPSCRVPLFDDSEDVFYIKTTDKYGVPTVKRYRFEEEVPISIDNQKAVSLNDIRSIIKDELASIKEELLNGQQSISTTDNTTVDSDVTKPNNAKSAARSKQRSIITDVGTDKE